MAIVDCPHRDLSLYRPHPDALELRCAPCDLSALRSEVAKLAKFKAYVHQRLDNAGVPVDPESAHRAAGCRIGGRLDHVFAELQRVTRERDLRGKAWDADVRQREAAMERLRASLSAAKQRNQALTEALRGLSPWNLQDCWCTEDDHGGNKPHTPACAQARAALAPPSEPPTKFAPSSGSCAEVSPPSRGAASSEGPDHAPPRGVQEGGTSSKPTATPAPESKHKHYRTLEEVGEAIWSNPTAREEYVLATQEFARDAVLEEALRAGRQAAADWDTDTDHHDCDTSAQAFERGVLSLKSSAPPESSGADEEFWGTKKFKAAQKARAFLSSAPPEPREVCKEHLSCAGEHPFCSSCAAVRLRHGIHDSPYKEGACGHCGKTSGRTPPEPRWCSCGDRLVSQEELATGECERCACVRDEPARSATPAAEEPLGTTFTPTLRSSRRRGIALDTPKPECRCHFSSCDPCAIHPWPRGGQ